MSERVMVSALGTHRRVQALIALGWSTQVLADRCGTTRAHLRRMLDTPRVSVRMADRVAAVFEQLCMRVPSPVSDQDRQAVARTKAYAARQGWVPPLAWDDIDRDAAPAVVEVVGPVFDHAAVELAIAGKPVRLSPAERRECVARLHGRKWSDKLIGAHLRCSEKTVSRIRERLHLEAWDLHDRIDRSAA